MSIRLLAHRGLWLEKSEQNAPEALRRSLDMGYGLETDIRDRNGALVVSHDCPGEAAPLLSTVWDSWKALASSERPLALNVKADGLAAHFVGLVPGLPAGSVFFFDMSVPDMRHYLGLGLPVFTRHSDVERQPAYYEQAEGVWLDALEGPWMTHDAIQKHLDNGKAVAVVSEELHGRGPDRQWRMLRSFRDDRRVLVCTDRPHAFQDFIR
jgi:hypothetical protein